MKIASIKNKIPQAVVLIVILLLVGFRTSLNREKGKNNAAPSTEILSSIQKVTPTAAELESDGVEQWSIRSANGSVIGKAIVAQQTTSEIIGYSGPIPLAIIIDNNDKIVGVSLLPNDETPRFVERVVNEGFTQKWNGLTAEQSVSKDMDAISGATYSSVAIAETVKQRLSEYSKTEAAARSANLKELLSYAAIAGILIYALAFYFFPQRLKKLRITLLVLAIGVLGFYYGSFLSMKLIGSWFILGVSLKNQAIFVTIALLAILLPFIFGKNFYCTYVCPFGASQELLAKLNPKKLELPKNVVAVLAHTRSKVMLIILAIAIFGSTIDITEAEPFTLFLFSSVSKGVVVLAVAFLLLSIAIPRSWCRFFCPTGAFIDFFRKEGKDIFPKKVSIKTHLIAFLVAAALVFLLLAKQLLG